jgi:hypothetical protein
VPVLKSSTSLRVIQWFLTDSSVYALIMSKHPEGTLCFSCSERPATVTKGSVMLCSVCAQIAEDNKRGVKFETKDSTSN